MLRKIQFILILVMPLCLLGQKKANPVLLPNGWKLTPAGLQYPLGDLPLNIAVSPNQKFLAVTNNGYGRQCVQIYNVKTQKMTADVTLKKSWYGLCFSPNGKKLYVSGGNDNFILVFPVDKEGHLAQSDTIKMGEPWPYRVSPTGIACNKKLNQVYVVTRNNDSLYIYDGTTDTLQMARPIGGMAYDIIFNKDESKAYISCWSCEQVKVWNVAKKEWEKPINVGTHPNELCMDKKGRRLFVANAEDNTVSVVNLAENRVEETLNAAPYESKLEGSTTNGLAVTPNGKILAIANADNNCLTLFDISKPCQSRALGFIPTGWYPTNVVSIGKNFWVANGKGLTSKPNLGGPQPIRVDQDFGHHTGDRNNTYSEYIAGLFLGALSEIKIPNEKELAAYSKQVYQNTPYQRAKELQSDAEPGNPIPQKVGDKSPIKYVYYIIKENRTYDQILGDMKEGNGDSTLCLFGEKYTPNLHKMAREYVLLDNFYVNAEVSCDGHNWSMGGYANDYLEKIWPSSYSGRGGLYPAEGYVSMGNNKSGFLWDNCAKHGVSYRSYGEFVHHEKNKIVGRLKSLDVSHVSQVFDPWNLNFYDTARVSQFKADYDSLKAIDALPQFSVVRFGCDHTMGMRLGRRSPYAMVADNDMACGLFVDFLSHQPEWKETAVFIVEDDAQNGADHVDAHRSTAYVAGGFVKHHYVDSTPYTTTSMLRTMELILGLPPMTQYDACARSMWRCFDKKADVTPFEHVKSNVDITAVNTEQSRWQKMSETFNFDREDDVPDMEFNKVLWFGLKGDNVAYPPLRRSAFLTYSIGDDDDDDD